MRGKEIGKLRQKVTIQRRSDTRDAHGHKSTGWVNVLADVWASVRPIGGAERLRAMAVQSILTHEVVVRYNPAIVAIEADAWRIQYGTRYFNISAARDLEEAHGWIVFDCTEGGNGN
jgi:SPP1 family predicted phage head-tail adaptor